MAAYYEDDDLGGDDDFVEFAFRAHELLFGNSDALPPVSRHLRDRENPLEIYDDAEFAIRYRFSKRTVRHLLGMLELQASADGRGSPLPPMLELLITLRFYGAATFQRVTGDLVNVSQPAACRAINIVSDTIAKKLFAKLVRFPKREEMSIVMRDFFEVAQFPGVTGCIDCTHVRIKSPGGDNAEVYRNRKGYFSINVQAIAGPQLQFFDVVVSWPGSAHDSRIFDHSRARVMYEQHQVPGVLLGDQGYACHPFLLTPLANPGSPGSPQYKYNKAQIKTRNVVERAFGVWKRRFPCLDMKLQNKVQNAVTIITACAALHNLGRKLCDPCPPCERPPMAAEPQDAGAPLQLPPLPTPQNTVSGVDMRNRIIARSFS